MILVSAERPEFDATSNNARSKDLMLKLLGLGLDYSHASGKYKDTLEKSYAIEGSEVSPVLLSLLREFQQESALLVGADDQASLVYVNSGFVEPIGVWIEVDELEAKTSHAYTEIYGRFYIVKPTK